MKTYTKTKVRIVVISIWSALIVICVAARWTNGSVRTIGAETVNGTEIYTANCAKCHGDDGRAKTSKGKRVEATDLTSDWNRDEERGIKIITKGKGDMPAFKDKLTADEIKEVFSYVLKFRAEKK